LPGSDRENYKKKIAKMKRNSVLIFQELRKLHIYTPKYLLLLPPGGGGGGGWVLPIMACMGRLCPKGVPFSGFRYIEG